MSGAIPLLPLHALMMHRKEPVVLNHRPYGGLSISFLKAGCGQDIAVKNAYFRAYSGPKLKPY